MSILSRKLSILSPKYGLLLALLTISPANAALVFDLSQESCSSGCTILPAGTVTLTQTAVDNVLVEIQLVSGYSIRDSGNNHHSFLFNIAGALAITVSGIVTGQTDTKTFFFDDPPEVGGYSQAGFGTFEYLIDCESGNGPLQCPNNNAQNIRQLSFTVTGIGLTESSFIANASGYYFSLDVGGTATPPGLGQTGNVAANSFITTTGVPEPSSVLLLSSALCGVIAVRRRRSRSK